MALHHPGKVFVLAAACAIGGALLTGEAARGQAVQLPTFQYTTVNTTVSVPDRGTMSLGGVNRASSGSVSRGLPLVGKTPLVNRLFNNRGIGQTRGASNMSVTATIIDHQELDEFILGEAAARTTRGESPLLLGSAPRTPEQVRGRMLAEHVARQEPWAAAEEAPRQEPPGRETLAEIQARNALAREQRGSEAEAYYEKALALELEGKTGAAKIYYQMAARRAEGPLQREIATRLENLNGARIAGGP